MPFIHDDFLLSTPAARRLYHDFAEDQPILDYHTHLPPEDIASNRRFNNLYEIWLEGDHYKWRAMRANGIEEKLCTGDADPYDKYMAWARTIPHTLRNPLYHWTHLELKRYFDIDELLNETTAPDIWKRAEERLASDDMTVHAILKHYKVRAVCTTDDPVDSLEYHRAIAESNLETRVYPTYRPDKAMAVDTPDIFNAWLEQLAACTNRDIATLNDLVDGLKNRHDYFHELGGRLSDHGMSSCFADFCSDAKAAAIFDKARAGNAASPDELRQFSTHMMLHFGRWDAEKGWTKQMHLGPIRNNRSRLLEEVGPDIGTDSMDDQPQARTMSAYFDALDRDNALPKTVIYNLNPRDNYLFATMVGNFQDGITPGKMQFGSGWWYADQKDGMEQQMNTLSNVGLLSRFIGMLTDSRSFMSCPRHEYFRRVLCNLVGRDVENGEVPNDDELVGTMISNICFNNAKDYLGLEL